MGKWDYLSPLISTSYHNHNGFGEAFQKRKRKKKCSSEVVCVDEIKLLSLL